MSQVDIKLDDIILELRSIHRQLNQIFFEGKLHSVQINIENNIRRRKVLTQGTFEPNDNWSSKESQITIWTSSLDGDYYNIIAILLHEMVHQFNYENGIKDVENNQRHNKKFRDAALRVELSLPKTVRGYGTNSKKGFMFTEPSESLKKIIDEKLDFNKSVFSLKHNYAINRAQKGYSSRNTYTCLGCNLKISSSKELNLKCLDCDLTLTIK